VPDQIAPTALGRSAQGAKSSSYDWNPARSVARDRNPGRASIGWRREDLGERRS
jgi:hypothetical protein